MSQLQEINPKATPRFITIIKKLFNFILSLTVIAALSFAFSFLGEIHGKSIPETYYSNGVPSILTLLDSEIFMGFVFVVTILLIIYVFYLLWELHEVAIHKAEAMSSAHTQIVFALSLCGLFIDKMWWVLAIIIAFARWDILADKLSKIINNGVRGDK